jgi:antitoxin (DNA-binding transcriptional repressor) of toxin-antitoxin stability system
MSAAMEAQWKTVDRYEFPAICLELIDEVEASGKPIEITRNGRAVIRVEPIDDLTRAQFAD